MLMRSLVLSFVLSAWAGSVGARYSEWAEEIREARLKNTVEVLSSVGSRVVGYPGHEEAARYILKKFKEIAGLLGSAVVDIDGLPISADLPLNKRPEKLCSLVSRLLQVGERSLKAAGIGPLREMILEGDKGRIIARNEGKLLLIALTDKNSSLGILKIEIEEFARKIKDIVS